MRHKNHRASLGIRPEHRRALLANLSAALIKHGEVTTTLTRAKALRPYVEKVITLAKKASANKDSALHLRRQAMALVRDKDAVTSLFNEKVNQFANRVGGYTRIYKLVPRIGDASEMGLIRLIAADDAGYAKRKQGKKAAAETAAPAATAEASAPAAQA